MTAAEFSAAPSVPESPFRVVVAGHVDHGKSTLVGRLLHETGALPDGKLAEVEATCKRRNMHFEWAFVTDALQPERDQGVTIDVSYIRFRTAKRPYVLVDAPGHREFLKNMISGAAGCDGAVLVVDASEGVREQSRRHAYVLALMGVQQLAVVVTKMDLVAHARDRFAAIEAEIRAYLAGINLHPEFVVPVSARGGDNIAARSANTPWYGGPTVLGALDSFTAPASVEDLPLRLPIQDVYKFDDRRIFAGRIETGRLRVGDTIVFSPSNRTAKVKAIEHWGGGAAPTEAGAGQSIGFTLDDQIFAERGELVSHVQAPPVETNVFRARLFWLGRTPLTTGRTYTLKLLTRQVPAEVQEIERVVDTGDLSSTPADKVERNAVAEVVLRTRAMLALDPHTRNARTGRFVLADGYDVAGGGLISMEGYPDQRGQITVRSTNLTEVEHRVTAVQRAMQNNHRGGVLWLTGLSGAGKSTLAIELEQRLFTEGYHVYVLDGDNVRRGLNADLGFNPDGRAENIRRVGEVAALFADAGMVVITAFISPYRSDRDRARAAAPRNFHEVFVKADLAVCEARDPKGLYKRARAGQIADFTGISAPYEAPDKPELVVDTSTASVDECLATLVAYVRGAFAPEAKT
jgi:bifunctional enzyme CysN/CysC